MAILAPRGQSEIIFVDPRERDYITQPISVCLHQCWRSRSRSASQRSIFTSIVWIEDLENSASISTFNRDRQDHDLDLRSFPPRSNNAVVACCVCKFRCYITEYRCIVCIVAAMCSIQCRAMCCVIAGTTALLSVLLFTSSC